MHERALGKTDVRLTEITLGTWGLATDAYGRSDEKRFEEVVKKALDEGVTTFDMAPLWGKDGAAERVVAKVVEEAKKRDEVRYVTRACATWDGDEVKREVTKQSVVESCEASLARLATDRIDLLLLHQPNEEIWLREDWREGVEALKKDGKIRAWGASVATLDEARMAVNGRADAICLTYNVLATDDLHDLSVEISAQGTGVLARSPLFHGLLAGRWAEYRSFPKPDHRRDRWNTEAFRARVRQVDRLRYLVHDEVTTLAEAALRFVLANALVTSAVVGARTPSQVEAAKKAANGPPYLPEDDLVRIPSVLAATGA